MNRHASLLFALPLAALATVAACGTDDATPAPDTVGNDASVDARIAPAVDAGPRPPGDDATVPADGGANVDVAADVAAYTDALAKAVCARLAACCSTADRDAFFGRYLKADGSPFTLAAAPSNATCEPTLKAQLTIVHDKWRDSVLRGAMTFDSARASACVQTLGAATCGAPVTAALAGDNACFDTRRGAVWKRAASVGATCRLLSDGVAFYSECDQAAGFCETFSGGKQQPTGTCKAWSKTGEACGVKQGQPKALCAPGLQCSNPSGGKCNPIPADKPPAQKIGDTCSFADYSVADCPAGSYCDTFGSRTCVASKADGQTCQFSDECQTPHWASCARRTCNTAGFCNGDLRDPVDAGTGGDSGTDAGDSGTDAGDSGAADAASE